jgi:hypothetical protein
MANAKAKTTEEVYERAELTAEMQALWEAKHELAKAVDNVIDTSTKILLRQINLHVGELHSQMKSNKSRARTLWNAFWAGMGTVKAEGDKVIKE